VIFYWAEGGLGNQIFQYAFLKTIQKNDEKIIVTGLEELTDVFEIKDIINLKRRNVWVSEGIRRIIKPVLLFLSQKKIISSLKIDREVLGNGFTREIDTYTIVSGFFKRIKYVHQGFFQSEIHFDKEIVKSLKFKEHLLKDAELFLQSVPCEMHKVFVHIRRCDYKDFFICGKSTLLPLQYFKKQIKWFQENLDYAFFVFLSDEPDFVHREFREVTNKIVSQNKDMGGDLAVMTLCKSAILSPSSYGWWGSYLMTDRDTVVCPKYWLGFSSEVEYHYKAVPSYAREIVIS